MPQVVKNVTCRYATFPKAKELGRRVLPVLGNVKAPFKLEMLLLVVVYKVGNGIVVTASEHAAGGFFLLD